MNDAIKNPKAFFDRIPMEMKLAIFSYLSPSELLHTISLVNNEWNNLSKNLSLWKQYGINSEQEFNEIVIKIRHLDKDLLKAVKNNILDLNVAIKTQNILSTTETGKYSFKEVMEISRLLDIDLSKHYIDEQKICTSEQLLEAKLINSEQADSMFYHRLTTNLPLGLAKALALKLITCEQVINIGKYGRLYLLASEKGLKALMQEKVTPEDAISMGEDELKQKINGSTYSSEMNQEENDDLDSETIQNNQENKHKRKPCVIM